MNMPDGDAESGTLADTVVLPGGPLRDRHFAQAGSVGAQQVNRQRHMRAHARVDTRAGSVGEDHAGAGKAWLDAWVEGQG